MNRRIGKQIGLILVCLMMIIMMWEGQKTDAAVLCYYYSEQSIRLRILANSDAAGDQLVKREIRDAVVAQMGEWVGALENPQSLEQARYVIREHLSEIENRVGEELMKRGLTYDYQVELGTVPFPTKLYGVRYTLLASMKRYGLRWAKAKGRTGGVYCSRHSVSSMQVQGTRWLNQRQRQSLPQLGML